MNPAQLLAHFDRIAEAPDAVPRLRRFILDLAVRGKLIGQDPNDEPADALLCRIQAEKRRLNQRDKSWPPVGADEAAYEVPPGWQWVRVRQVTADRGQTIPKCDFTYIDVGAINKEAGAVGSLEVVPPAEAPSRARKVVRRGDVIYSCVRPYLLNVAVIDRDFVPAPIASTAFAVLNGFGLVLARYLWVVLRSPSMVESVKAKMRGQAYPAINDADFAALPLPLPPLAEQHRIVAQVDELMTLCDRLEAAQTEREARRDRVVAASLSRLGEPAADGSQSFRDHPRFHLRHLPRLTIRPEHIQQLRQTILNLAVRGRVVPQDSRDEPACELLDRLKAEADRLDARRKSRKQSVLVPVGYDDRPYALPSSWLWVRTEELATCISDGVHKKPKYLASGVPFLTVGNLTEGPGISFRQTRFISEEDHREFVKRTHPERGDVLITKDGTIGVTRVIETDQKFSLFVSVALVKMIDKRISRFFALCFNSELIRALISPKGAALKHLHLVDLRSLPVPLPPLAEQDRIVAKVDELMAICEQLEAQLTTAQTESRRLLEAVLQQALSPVA